MAKDKPDTVTPPTDNEPTENPAPLNDGSEGRPSADQYTSKGGTTVATRPGYAHNDSTGKFPTITSSGLTVTADEAKVLVDEGNGRVFIVTDNNEEG